MEFKSVLSNAVSGYGYYFKSGGISLISNTVSGLLSYYYKDNNLFFIAPKAYDNVYVYSAERTATQIVAATLSNAYQDYLKKVQTNKAKQVYNSGFGSEMKVIIENKTKTESAKSYPKDRYGRIVPDSITLSKPLETPRNVVVTEYDMSTGKFTVKKTSKTVSSIDFVDLSPTINVKSDNNIVLSKVVGRDASRKEFVSGGDLTFSVSGKITSDFPDVYPYDDVNKFLEIIKYKGIIDVKGMIFDKHNVTKILIQDWSLDQGECMNSQPYSFSCVAIEAATEVTSNSDTINTINQSISETTNSGWFKETVKDVVGTSVGTVIDESLDFVNKLTNKII